MPPTFLIRKVGKRISHRTYHFTLAKAFEIPNNFAQKYHFTLVKLLKFQETFLEKFLVSGFGADSPNILCTQKSTALPCFYFLPQIFRILPICLYLTYKFAERFGVRHVRHALPNGICRYDFNIAFISVYKRFYGVGNEKLAF